MAFQKGTCTIPRSAFLCSVHCTRTYGFMRVQMFLCTVVCTYYSISRDGHWADAIWQFNRAKYRYASGGQAT